MCVAVRRKQKSPTVTEGSWAFIFRAFTVSSLPLTVSAPPPTAVGDNPPLVSRELLWRSVTDGPYNGPVTPSVGTTGKYIFFMQPSLYRPPSLASTQTFLQPGPNVDLSEP